MEILRLDIMKIVKKYPYNNISSLKVCSYCTSFKYTTSVFKQRYFYTYKCGRPRVEFWRPLSSLFCLLQL